MRTKSPTYENITKTYEKLKFFHVLEGSAMYHKSLVFSSMSKKHVKKRRREQKPPTCLGSLPRCPQDVPRPPKDFPRRPKMAPRWRQDLRKRPSNASRAPPDAPKMHPRCTQDDLRTPKTSTKAPQEPPRPSRDAPDPLPKDNHLESISMTISIS